MDQLNTTHTVRIIQDNRGTKFLFGAVAIFLLVRWWLTGSILNVFEAVQHMDPDEEVANAAGSIADTLVPIGLDMVIAVGGILLGVTTGIWQIAWDSIRAGLKYLHANQVAATLGTNVAVQAATNAATATQSTSASPRVDPAKLKVVLTQLDERVKRLEAAAVSAETIPESEVETEPAGEVDRVTALERQIAELTARLQKQATPVRKPRGSTK